MTSHESASVVRIEELQGSETASTLHRHEHGAQVSFFLNHNKAGSGPKLHRHSRGATHRQFSIHPVARMETEWLE